MIEEAMKEISARIDTLATELELLPTTQELDPKQIKRFFLVCKNDKEKTIEMWKEWVQWRHGR